jgi:hypothetical protein
VSLYRHVPHPHVAHRREHGPVKVADALPHGNPVSRFNSRAAVIVTRSCATMYCAYLFCLLAFYGLPAGLRGGSAGFVQWASSQFLQLVLLPVILVGSAVLAETSDRMAKRQFDDVEAILHGQDQVAQHLAAQDEKILAILEQIEAGTALTEEVRAALALPETTRPAKRLVTPAEYVDKRAASTTLSAPHLPERPKRLMTFTDKIRAADGDTVRGEAAFLLACNAKDADDWRLLADALDLSGAAPDWGIARCCRVTLTVIRPGEAFSANRLRQVFPRRAWPLISGALKALALYGFIASTQQTERSTAPGSRGWRVAVYRLTRAGEDLREEFVPAVRTDGIMWPAEARFGEGVPGSGRRLQKVS